MTKCTEAAAREAALYRSAQDCLAEALAMMVIFKKTNIRWDWEGTEENLKRAAVVLADISPAAAALLAQGERLSAALNNNLYLILSDFALDAAEWGDDHGVGCGAREWAAQGDDWINDWVACGICRMAEGLQRAFRIRAALAPGEEKE